MNKEDILKNAKKLFDAYKSIPRDAIINSITGESVLNETATDKEYDANLHVPYGMMKLRKEEDVSVLFLPVFYYADNEMGIYVSYYNVKAQKSLKVGPFKTAEELTDALYEYKDLKAMIYILGALQTDAGFVNTYQNVEKQFVMKIEQLPELPLMQIVEKDSFLGPVLTVATRYINNPYAYNDVKMEVIRIDGFSGSVTVHYNEPIARNSNNLGDKLWDKFSKKEAKEVLQASVEKIKQSRKREDEFIKRVKAMK